MKLNAIYGDIIIELESGEYDYAAHGCNCMGVMGSGVAPILNNYTNGALLDVDRSTELGNINKMGSFSMVSHETKAGNIIDICNFYTQFEPRSKEGMVVVHWESYRNCMMELLELANISSGGVNIIIPMIGCGLAGGSLENLLQYTREAVQDYQEAMGQTPNSTINFISNDRAMAVKMAKLINLT